MTIRGLFLTGLLWTGTSLTLHAQDNLTVRAARTAFDEFDFPRAIVLAQQALLQSLSNADEITALEVLGITVSEMVGHAFPPNPHNEDYLRTKREKAGHRL